MRKENNLLHYFFIHMLIVAIALTVFLQNHLEKKEDEQLQDAYFELRKENWSLNQELHDSEQLRSDISEIDAHWNRMEYLQKEESNDEDN